MSIESELKKDGIKVIEKLDEFTVYSIAVNVSIRLCSALPNLNIEQKKLQKKLSNIDMYIAEMPDGMADANYYFKNSSIYFNKNINFDNIQDYAVHECIHFIQEVKDNKNYLVKMGLSDYTGYNIKGLGINEAAVQLMSSKILGTASENVKYFNIYFDTISPSYYPIECCLVNQLAYLIGENVLFDSTINSNDNFKNKLIEATSKDTYNKIQDSIDTLLNIEEKIIKINNKLLKINNRTKKVDHYIEKINEYKKEITSTFINTQNLITTSYFDKKVTTISNVEDIEDYRKQLYEFKDYLGSTDNYNFFNEYYVNKMMILEEKYNLFENKNLSLVPKKDSKISLIFKALRKIFIKNNATNLEGVKENNK